MPIVNTSHDSFGFNGKLSDELMSLVGVRKRSHRLANRTSIMPANVVVIVCN
jgi:hypothetical protein